MLKKIDRFYNYYEENIDKLACPLCQTGFSIEKYTLKCQNKHQFDLNKKGFVNFLNHKVVENYTKEMFEPRGKMIQSGMYNGMLDFISERLDGQSLLDVGCGEGSFLNLLNFEGANFGFDIARDGIILATNQEHDACWSVADLTKLPYKTGSIDNILNIFTPSNYKEFKRVASPQGQIIKVVPDRYYLQELRMAYDIPVDYDNSSVLEKFKENYQSVEEHEIKYTFVIPEELRLDFLNMSPLEWQVTEEKKDQVKKNPPKEATVHVQVLIGK